MSKPKYPFISFFQSQSRVRLCYAFSLFTLVLFYPGHNPLQLLTLTPKPISSFTPPFPSPSLAPYPLLTRPSSPPHTARAALVQDADSATILYSLSPDNPLAPASITKLMTALVVLDHWQLDDILTVTHTTPALGQTIDLLPGESLRVHDLLKGLLIHSGNDAALVFADNYPGGYTNFVMAMNSKAASLHLARTVYKNPSGIDQYGHTTTARDVATLAKVALRNPIIQQITLEQSLTISDVTNTHFHQLESTDALLGILPGLLGGKTGYTASALECFVAYVEREGRGIISVVLGSRDRFGDTTRLVEWAYSNHTWVNIDVPK